MTIDEAIKQEKERAVDCRQGAEVVKNMTYATWERENLLKQYIERAEYHEQLAEWLEDYKRINKFNDGYYKVGYTKAIDDFAEKIRDICSNHSIGADSKNNNEPLYAHKDGTWHSLIDKIAEQLKEGAI